MARHIYTIYRISGTLQADSALSIAHGIEGDADDMVCVRDGLGRPVIPGTALAGVLRHRLGVNAIWGDERDPAAPGPVNPQDKIQGSQVWVEDSPAEDLSVPAKLERRDGVAIDRHTGAAATGALYSREVVPAGTRFTINIAVEERFNETSGHDLIQALRALLLDGISIGGATSRGLGRMTLKRDRLTFTKEKVGTRDGILARLRGTPGEDLEVATPAHTASKPVIFHIPWRPTGPLLVKVAANGLADATPLSTRPLEQSVVTDDGSHRPCSRSVRFVVPGSSIKGVLRTRAERILRTLTATGTGRVDKNTQDPMAMTNVLFGSPAGTAEGRRGLLTVLDCHSEPVGSWDHVMSTLEQARGSDPRQQTINLRLRSTKSEVELIDHVAIDRWTGGSDDGRLFSLIAPQHGSEEHPGRKWDPIRLELDVAHVPEGIEPKCLLALVALLLRDLADGDIPIGHGTTRGYGEITADLNRAQVLEGEQLPGLSHCTVADLLTPDGSGAEPSGVDAAWRSYVAKLSTSIEREHVHG